MSGIHAMMAMSGTSGLRRAKSRALGVALAGVVLGGAWAGSALAQTPIFSQGSADKTRPALNPLGTTASGTAAPAGTFFSELSGDATSASAIAGFSGHGSALTSVPYRFASRVVVPVGGGWKVSSTSVYAYQPGTGITSSPFASVNLRVWAGKPGDVGATVVFGDTTTNRLGSSVFSGVYRVFSTRTLTGAPGTAPDTTRPIWQLDATTPGLVLTPGTYWFDWQIVSVDPNQEAFVPTLVVPGSRGPASGGVQFKSGALGTGQWLDMIDPGKPASVSDTAADVPFIVRGTSKCNRADVLDPGGLGDFDGVVEVPDLFAYLQAWFSQNLGVADLGSGANPSTPDGRIDVDDIFIYLSAFFSPCV